MLQYPDIREEPNTAKINASALLTWNIHISSQPCAGYYIFLQRHLPSVPCDLFAMSFYALVSSLVGHSEAESKQLLLSANYGPIVLACQSLTILSIPLFVVIVCFRIYNYRPLTYITSYY